MNKYLCLPIAATGINLILALLFSKLTTRVSAHLIPAKHEEIGGSATCLANENGNDACLSEKNISSIPLNIPSDYPLDIPSSTSTGQARQLRYASEDPLLKTMPNINFKAYVRPDVSTFYREDPGSRKEVGHEFTGQAGKFINMTPDRLNLYWDSGRGNGHFSGDVGPYESSGTATFPGHRFFFGKTEDPKEAICSFVVKVGTLVYFCDPYSDDQGEPARGHTRIKRDVSELGESDFEMYQRHKYNIEFSEQYMQFTGFDWLGMYPRDPPRHKIWSADHFGQEHQMITKETQFVEMPPWELLGQINPGPRINESIPLQKYRNSNQTQRFTLRVLSCAPRIFEIRNFISHVEADHILMLTNRTHNLHRSMTGDATHSSQRDSTRTSLNTWVNREESPIIDSIYRRVANLLGIDEALLRVRSPEEHPELGTKQSIAESLQMVHYDVGQEYTAHHDFGYDQMSEPYQPSRSINVLLYLNDVEEGGETSFPRWMNAESKGSLDVKPEKGKAVLFYMLLPDGNSDDLTQHAALPVIRGEKWMSNLWIWDPFKKF